MKLRRGIVLVTALVMAMVGLLLITGLAARVQTDVCAVRRGAAERQRFYLAKAMVNQMIALLNKDGTWESRDKSDPYVQTYDGVEVRGWVARDEAYPNLLHVHATAAGQHFTRVVKRTTDSGGMLYAAASNESIVFVGPATAWGSAIFAKQPDSDWTSLPLPPGYGVTYQSVVQVCPDFEGGVFANFWDATVWQFDERTQQWSRLPSPPAGVGTFSIAADAEAVYVADHPWSGLWASNPDYGWTVDRFVLAPARYDRAQGTWSQLPALPNVYYDSLDALTETGQNVTPFGKLTTGGGGNVYGILNARGVPGVPASGANPILRLDGDRWTPLPPLPHSAGQNASPVEVAAGSTGDLYASASAEGAGKVFRYSGGAWAEIPQPSRSDIIAAAPGTTYVAPIPSVSADAEGNVILTYATYPKNHVSFVAGDEGYDRIPSVPPTNRFGTDQPWRGAQKVVGGNGSIEGAVTSYIPTASF